MRLATIVFNGVLERVMILDNHQHGRLYRTAAYASVGQKLDTADGWGGETAEDFA